MEAWGALGAATQSQLFALLSLLPPLHLPPQGNDYALRYHDLHANRFLRYFRGHTGRVTTLAMSPRSDAFLSAAQDKQARRVAPPAALRRRRAARAVLRRLLLLPALFGRCVLPLPPAHALHCPGAASHPDLSRPEPPPRTHSHARTRAPLRLQVRLWDLRVSACQALLQAPGLPTSAFDEQGLVFAVGAERGVVKLYDARNWGAGPFTSFPVGGWEMRLCVWQCVGGRGC